MTYRASGLDRTAHFRNFCAILIFLLHLFEGICERGVAFASSAILLFLAIAMLPLSLGSPAAARRFLNFPLRDEPRLLTIRFAFLAFIIGNAVSGVVTLIKRGKAVQTFDPHFMRPQFNTTHHYISIKPSFSVAILLFGFSPPASTALFASMEPNIKKPATY